MPNEGYIMFKSKNSGRRIPKTTREVLEDRLDAKPETGLMQRHKLMTREEKHRGAIDTMTRDVLKDNQKEGKYASEESVRKDLIKYADKADKTGAIK